jgi:hypothetical protein
VVDSSTGQSKDSEVRTSTGTFFSKGQDEVITRIERRVAQVGGLGRGVLRGGRHRLASCSTGCGAGLGDRLARVCA